MKEIYRWLKDRHGLNISGVLHIGANTGQEAQEYAANGWRTVWVEGDPTMCGQLQDNISLYRDQEAYCCLCSDQDNQPVTLFVASNNGGSSSVLAPNQDVFSSCNWPRIIGEKQLVSRRLDNYLLENKVSLERCNLIEIDVQGFELPSLVGLGAMLDGFDAVIAELNWAKTYHGATRPTLLDSYLSQRGFCCSWLSIGYPQGEGVWLRKPRGFITQLYMRSSMRILEMLASLGFFRFLQKSKWRKYVRSLYYRFKGRTAS